MQKFIYSGVLSDPINYQTLAAIFVLPMFLFFGYFIEVAAAAGIPRKLTWALIFINEAALLVYPIAITFAVESHPLLGTYLSLLTCCLWLKLLSYHHLHHDVRKLIREVAELKSQGKAVDHQTFQLT